MARCLRSRGRFSISDKPSLLIIGAGPVGLTVAVECARRGMEVTILDRTPGPTDESRAVGVNRQSLLLLEACGAAKDIQARSVTLERAAIHDNGKRIATLDFPKPEDGGPPSLVLLSQSETERALIDVLVGYGVMPRWNSEAQSVQQDDASATVTLTTGERLSADYILGADGSRSIVRKSLDLDFPGKQYEEIWSLMDVELDWPLRGVQAAPYFEKDGSVLFVIEIGGGVYRAISNRDDVEEDVGQRFFVKRVLWKNDFTVSLRGVESYGRDRIWIAGDAAHIHSPVGGMGMNLGIEDASDFAATLADGRDFAAFEVRRLAAAKRVLALSDRGYRIGRSTNPFTRFARNSALRIVANTGFLQRMAARRVFRQGVPDFSAPD